MSAFKNKNSLRTIKAEISQKAKNSEVRPNFTGSYKKSVYDSAPKVTMLSTFLFPDDDKAILDPQLEEMIFICRRTTETVFQQL